MQLAPREWLGVLAIVVAADALVVASWPASDAAPGAGRLPYALRDDYWAYERLVEQAGRERVLVVGDSVIWGQFVAPEATLPARLGGGFVNAGIDGLHGVAFEGLVRHHGRPLQRRRVVAYWNFTWIQTPTLDLAGAEPRTVHHPRLLPQLAPELRFYRAPAEERLTILAEQYLPLPELLHHLRLRYFDNHAPSGWLLEHPYATPLGPLLDGPSPARDPPPPPERTWRARGLQAGQDVPWVAPARSRQYAAFGRAVERLRAGGADVFVVIGDFNRVLLSPKSAARLRAARDAVAADLGARGFAYALAPELPPEEYADASHPLGAGYARMAAALARDPTFRAFLRKEP